ncbi:trypsin-like serine peptidase [Polyangium aurulentum]|uniref:trypsin-like serine peptidase n=1 Tax=Polyangium aurulentum TaxID=2567896 RepID=UPI0010ADDEBE|nr:trypsin-like peptidase domain-containing protein [Polyangium aurulentum]UQA58082.1 trypsin-like peptidase domain-containing protein [Polyangium aurulentum]
MKTIRILGLIVAGSMMACVGAEDDLGGEDFEATAEASQPVIVGDVDWVNSTTLSGTAATRAKAVGYLSIPAQSSRCTAWLVSKDVAITNNHCIARSSQAKGAKISFNYEEGVTSGQRVWYDCSTFVATWKNLDMTALRCAPVNGVYPGDANGWLTVSGSDAADGAGIYVLHQNCDYNTTSSCSPTKKYSPGAILDANFSSTDASYDADTLGGSSGSPVLSATTNEVVALHHYGFGGDSEGRGTHNSGVRAGEIKPALASIGL